MQNPMDRQHPTEHWTTIGELRVRYLDWGGDGEPVMLMHGLASSAHWYELVASHLRHKYRLFAADARGHGQTPRPQAGMIGRLWQPTAWDLWTISASRALPFSDTPGEQPQPSTWPPVTRTA